MLYSIKEKFCEHLVGDECIYYALAWERPERKTALLGAVTNHLLSNTQDLLEYETGNVFTYIFVVKWKFCCMLLSQLKPKFICCRGQEGFGGCGFFGAERY